MDAEGGVYARESAYLNRWVAVGVASGRAIKVTFPDDADPGDHALLDRIFDYLDGIVRDDFDDAPIALTVPTDHRAVLERLRSVPYGTAITVDELARSTPGVDDDDRRTVQETLDRNPLPILLPDHRVRDGPSAAPPAVETKLQSLEGL
jgi:methylated-DNA-[protein]-cysteine S-methyltransferase